MKRKEVKLPHWIFRFLQSICPNNLIEEIEGDIIERFEQDIQEYGERKAQRRAIWNVIRFLRPGIIFRSKFNITLTTRGMLKNYFLIMFRNVVKQKLYSSINILGLTVGIAFALFLGIFIHQELQVNQNLNDVGQLYILESRYKDTSEGFAWQVPAPLAPALVDAYPTSFLNYYRFWDRSITVSKNDHHFRLSGMIGDSTFLQMFGFKVLSGNSEGVLSQPNTVIITEKVAHQYFGKTDVAGETLLLTTEVNGQKEFAIAAVIENPQQKNSVTDIMNLESEIFLPMANRVDFSLIDPDSWSAEIITYVKVSPRVSRSEIERTMNKLLSMAPIDLKTVKRSISANGLKSYYLDASNGAIRKLVIALSGIALFILLLAIFNFINITIASSFSRLKEVGVRKVIGGRKQQVVFQFLIESILLVSIATVLALVLYELLRSYASTVVDAPMPSITEFSLVVWQWIVFGIVATGLTAGSYPSLFLSATEAVNALKGKIKTLKGSVMFSRSLIGVQFFIAIFVFITALIMSNQISFFLEKDMGYDKSFVMVVTSVPRLWTPEGFSKIEAARQEFISSPVVDAASLSWGAPGNLSPFKANVYPSHKTEQHGIQTAISGADEDFLKVYNIKLLDGNFFANENGAMIKNGLVINEEAQRALSVQVGDKVKIALTPNIDFTIVGVINDFNFESLHEKVKPVAFMHNVDFQSFRYFSFKLKAGDLTASMEQVEKIWQRVFPQEPFQYTFLDQKLQSLYNQELKLKKAASIASVLMLVIIMTGVLGLVSLTVNKRNKEISIRKVLGASASSILGLLCREYVVIMVAAFAVSIPLTYLFIVNWLQEFAYHIQLQPWMFIVPIVFVFFLTIFVVGLQSLKTIVRNPVQALNGD